MSIFRKEPSQPQSDPVDRVKGLIEFGTSFDDPEYEYPSEGESREAHDKLSGLIEDLFLQHPETTSLNGVNPLFDGQSVLSTLGIVNNDKENGIKTATLSMTIPVSPDRFEAEGKLVGGLRVNIIVSKVAYPIGYEYNSIALTASEGYRGLSGVRYRLENRGVPCVTRKDEPHLEREREAWDAVREGKDEFDADLASDEFWSNQITNASFARSQGLNEQPVGPEEIDKLSKLIGFAEPTLKRK